MARMLTLAWAEVDIVLHLANAMDYRPATHLIRGLGERRKVTAEETFFVHVSLPVAEFAIGSLLIWV